jgi:hypothetical protein
LKDQSGKIITDVILGQSRETDNGGSGGQYLKKVDADTVFLVDGSFQFLKTAPAQWLKKEILDVNAEDVASVVCSQATPETGLYPFTIAEGGSGTDDARPIGTNRRCGES